MTPRCLGTSLLSHIPYQPTNTYLSDHIRGLDMMEVSEANTTYMERVIGYHSISGACINMSTL